MSFLKTFGNVVDMLLHAEEYKDLGAGGERFTYRELKRLFKESQILRNVYLKKENNEYTEVDLIVVCKKGIITLDSKNYSGWIFGNENQPNWVQTLEHGKKYKFYNPIWQNSTHIKSIQSNLSQYENIKYYSIIVFSERCELKDITCTTNDTYVVKRNNLADILKDIDKNNENTLTDDEVKSIITQLSPNARPSEHIKEQHLKELEESFSLCPRCKGKLVERENKKGSKSKSVVEF